jgi:hypothetical protein
MIYIYITQLKNIINEILNNDGQEFHVNSRTNLYNQKSSNKLKTVFITLLSGMILSRK